MKIRYLRMGIAADLAEAEAALGKIVYGIRHQAGDIYQDHNHDFEPFEIDRAILRALSVSVDVVTGLIALAQTLRHPFEREENADGTLVQASFAEHVQRELDRFPRKLEGS